MYLYWVLKKKENDIQNLGESVTGYALRYIRNGNIIYLKSVHGIYDMNHSSTCKEIVIIWTLMLLDK